jgi:hypothetical protein
MSDLLDLAITAHGGIGQWNQLRTITARLTQGGALWGLKGKAGVLDDVVVTAGLHERTASPSRSHWSSPSTSAKSSSVDNALVRDDDYVKVGRKQLYTQPGSGK